MNIDFIESALSVAFTSSDFSGATVYKGTDSQELTPESLNIIVACTQLEHVAGSLWKADIDVKLSAPALLGSDSYDSFQTALDTMTGNTLSNTYMNAYFNSGDVNFAGLWINNIKTSQHEHTWVAEISVTMGITQ